MPPSARRARLPMSQMVSTPIYSSTQGVYQLRGAIAQLLNIGPDQVRVVYMEGAGCYGDNGSDHAAGEAALLAQAMGRPVRVQWMRQDEHAWEPKGPAMVMQVRGALDGTGHGRRLGLPGVDADAHDARAAARQATCCRAR